MSNEPSFWKFSTDGKMSPVNVPESSNSDYTQRLKQELGFEEVTKLGAEYSPIQIDLWTADSTHCAFAIDIWTDSTGLGTVMFDDFPSFLLFLKEYASLFSMGLNKEISEALQAVNHYLFDPVHGLEAVQRVVRHEHEYRVINALKKKQPPK